ncbi:Cyclic di-GMP phosphodiesterase YfgF [Roseovarius albus]|uniref:Cyclic di-GMP phosphodiesterase YfgF n=1 Tax=Roseovarius albus TaxID=1247867 RepID=A0A1X6YRZ5_9RHOB|nr:EAL domain-containing protein [Roseovarius albus]SLN28889.1 Cyclic di-GMP phosphodiesterase YfgF [Roseovarius albus]
MGRDKEKWAGIPAGQDNALDYAVSQRDRRVIDMVDRAARHGEVRLAYQAIVPAGHHDRPAFYEGLIRVLDATGRVIPAAEFINEIEETETGRLIDCLALEKGIETLVQFPGLRLSINMSARSIGYPRWSEILQKGFKMDPTLAERLILEITERSAMLVPELVTSFMQDLQKQGVSFALDDFGAGFTSFRYLKNFYFDVLKIEGQFIRGIAENPDNQVLAAALIAIGRQFDMITVAENVETAADVAYLELLGVDCLQGYHFGAPTIQPPWAQSKTRKAKG